MNRNLRLLIDAAEANAGVSMSVLYLMVEHVKFKSFRVAGIASRHFSAFLSKFFANSMLLQCY